MKKLISLLFLLILVHSGFSLNAQEAKNILFIAVFVPQKPLVPIRQGLFPLQWKSLNNPTDYEGKVMM